MFVSSFNDMLSFTIFHTRLYFLFAVRAHANEKKEKEKGIAKNADY